MTSDRRLEIGRGDGTVVAVPGIAVFVVGEQLPPSLDQVVRAAAGTTPPGRDLARRLAGLLTGDDAADIPPFGAVADADDGLIVFLSGPVSATAVDGQGAPVRLSGSEATTWVDRLLGPETGSILIGPDATSADATTPFELTAGVVPAGWLRLTDGTAAPSGGAPDVAAQAPADSAAGPPEAPPQPEASPQPEPAAAQPEAAPPSPAAPPEAAPQPAAAPPHPEPSPAAAPAPSEPPASSPQPAPAEPDPETAPVSPPPIPPPAATPSTDAPDTPAAPPADEPATEAMPTSFESLSLAPDRDSIRAPLPTEAEGEPGEPDVDDEAVPERKMVQGIMCSRHHFNSPDSAYCSSCGISMVHATHNLVTRERPPLGFLVFDDGSTFTLDDRYVLGREPETDPLVRSEEARPIPLEDPQMSVSRVHAEIQLVGWDVQLMDRGSTNGTHVLNDRGDGWDRLVANQPRTVQPGARIAVGQRTFVYETPQRG